MNALKLIRNLVGEMCYTVLFIVSIFTVILVAKN